MQIKINNEKYKTSKTFNRGSKIYGTQNYKSQETLLLSKIDQALEASIEKMSTKYNLETLTLIT